MSSPTPQSQCFLRFIIKSRRQRGRMCLVPSTDICLGYPEASASEGSLPTSSTSVCARIQGLTAAWHLMPCTSSRGRVHCCGLFDRRCCGCRSRAVPGTSMAQTLENAPADDHVRDVEDRFSLRSPLSARQCCISTECTDVFPFIGYIRFSSRTIPAATALENWGRSLGNLDGWEDQRFIASDTAQRAKYP